MKRGKNRGKKPVTSMPRKIRKGAVKMIVSEERVTREERNRRQLVSLLVWKTDLKDIPYLREKVEFAKKVGYFKDFQEHRSFLEVVCFQGVVDWLFDGEPMNVEGVL